MEEKKEELTGNAAPRGNETINSISLQQREIDELICFHWTLKATPLSSLEWMELCCSLFERVRGGCGRNAPRWKRRQQQQLHEWKWRMEREWICLVLPWAAINSWSELVERRRKDKWTAPRGEEMKFLRPAEWPMRNGKDWKSLKWSVSGRAANQ